MMNIAPENYSKAPLASREIRWAAVIVDHAATEGFPALMVLYSFWLGRGDEALEWIALAWFMLVGMLQVCLLTYYGQSLGKMAFGTKIVLTSTGEIGGFFTNVLLRNVVNYLLVLVPGYVVADILMIFRRDRRCLHDWIAGTRVAQIRTPSLGAARIVNAGCVIGQLVILVVVASSSLAENGMLPSLARWQASWLTTRAERLVDKAQMEHGFRHPIVARRLGELASLHRSQQRYNEAIDTWDRGMRMFADAGGLHTLWAASYAQEIASMYVVNGQFDAAMPNLLYALQLHENPQLGWSQPAVDPAGEIGMSVIEPPPDFMYLYPNCLTLMGRVMAERGEPIEAESYYRRALEELEGKLDTPFYQDSDAATFIDPLVGLAGVSMRRMRYADARELLDRAWAIAEPLDPMRWEVAEVLRARAEYFAFEGDTRRAISDAQRALEIVRRFGDTQPDLRRFEDTLRQVKGDVQSVTE